MAALCSHIPNRGEPMVRTCGYGRSVSREKRKEAAADDALPCIVAVRGDEKVCRIHGARITRRIIRERYEVDTPGCPKCRGAMAIMGFIEDVLAIRAGDCPCLPLVLPTLHPTTSCGRFFIDVRPHFPYTLFEEKEILIKKINSYQRQQKVRRGRTPRTGFDPCDHPC